MAAPADKAELFPGGVDRFIKNVTEARENGYEELCAFCGIGLDLTGEGMHDRYCPRFSEEQYR